MAQQIWRSGAAFLLAVLVTACAPLVAPPLTGEQRAFYGIERVSLTLAPDARIWWREGTAFLAEADGVATSDPTALEAFEARPDTAKRLADLLLARIESPIAEAATAALYGPEPAQLSVVITDAVVAADGEIAFLGGTHRLAGVAQLFDLKTGAALSEPTRLEASGGGGAGLFGLAVDEAQPGTPMTRNAEAFGALLQRWLTASGTQRLALSADPAGPLPPIPSPVVTAPLAATE